MSRWVVVDDVTGTGISYGGVWQVSDGMLDDMPVDGGPPLYNTLHGARSHTSISYTFKGPPTFLAFVSVISAEQHL